MSEAEILIEPKTSPNSDSPDAALASLLIQLSKLIGSGRPVVIGVPHVHAGVADKSREAVK